MLLRQLPNLISASRFALTPFAVAAILHGDNSSALRLCLLGGATDYLDGALARRFGLTSRAGAILDPLADKFMLDALYLTLWLARGEWIAGLVLARDVLILAGSAGLFLATRRRNFPPSPFGKISTTVQFLWLIAVLLGVPGPWKLAADAALLIATIGSGVDYFRRGLNMFHHDRSRGN